MKKLGKCVVAMMLAACLLTSAMADWDPTRAFAKSECFDYNVNTGDWGWCVYYSTDEYVDANVWIGLNMNGTEEGFYLPSMTFSIEDPATNKLIDRIVTVKIKAGDFKEYYIPYLDTNSYGEQFIYLGKDGMKMVEQMQKWGFEYTFITENMAVTSVPDKSTYNYKLIKKEMASLLNSNWWKYCDPDIYQAIDEQYPIY